jgi:hypothetical protein
MLLLSPYLTTSPKPAPAKPLCLSPDGQLLIINGNVTLNFVSSVQISIIRRLVEGHQDGKRWRARELLNRTGSGVTTLRRAFGGKKWGQLKPFLASRNGLWGFDL